jgi:competence protein ComEA
MKKKLSSAVVLLVILLLAFVPIVLPPDVNAAAQKETAADLLDVNTATADQHKASPGIGDAYSGKIIKRHPYKRKDEWVQRTIIPQATYDKIKDQIVAKQK